MAERGIGEQLVKYLTDAHAIEEQALRQLRTAPSIAGHPRLERIFEDHLGETEIHERRMRERLAAHGAEPSRAKDLAARAGGAGFMLFARSQGDTPGKLLAHAYSFEHLELAAYDLLERVADRAGDAETAEVAREIRAEEAAMGDRLAGAFDAGVEASLAAVDAVDVDRELDRYLADAHAIEAQAVRLLTRTTRIAGEPALARAAAEHLGESRDHGRWLAERLEARGADTSTLKDAAMRLGALNWSAFFRAQPDTPAKLAAFIVAFEHLEIAGQEQLRRVARRAGDEITVTTVDLILDQERAAAERVAGLFDRALEASLDAVGVRS